MASIMSTREVIVPTEVPKAGLVVNVLLSMITISVLAVCFTRRLQSTKDFSTIPVTRWLLLAIYVDSILFIVATATLSYGFGVNLNQPACSSAILLCLVCYMTTKILIYYFLVEKVYIIRKKQTPRFKSKIYLFNCVGMLIPYCVVVVLNFYYRIAYFNNGGTCIIGMERKAMMPLIVFDAVLNVYLTLLFVIPLRGLYSYKISTTSPIRTIAVRSFVGSCATLISSLVNLTILMVLVGEPAWVCLMCCNADILFCVVVLHWVTSKDSSSTIASIPNIRSVSANRSGNHTPSVNQAGGPFYPSNAKPSVVTHISATAPATKDVEDIEEDVGHHWGKRSGPKDSAGYPLGQIRVEVGQTVEVESQKSASSTTQFDGELARARSNLSTEDLVERGAVPHYHHEK